ncbi:MAG: 5'/3'-nucleotidase SurE [Kiritimatiellae bacterium]|nr:5'/3'-nucleotidase SurE [Kiritimatiellia bacterium]
MADRAVKLMSDGRPRILVTNDDGIHAPGIRELARALRPLGRVTIVAPDTERSAVGHAITLSDPIKMRAVRDDGRLVGYAVGGTPADSVKLAVCALLRRRPDLVVSGINLGPNAGIAVLYSGTVSAATEGTLLHIPSLAISLNTFDQPQWATAARAAAELANGLLRHPLPRGVLLNVNVPNLPWEQIRGYAPARMARSRFVEVFHRRRDPRGNLYFWMDGYLETDGPREGTDLKLLADGWITLTPVHFDLTHHRALTHLRRWCGRLNRSRH